MSYILNQMASLDLILKIDPSSSCSNFLLFVFFPDSRWLEVCCHGDWSYLSLGVHPGVHFRNSRIISATLDGQRWHINCDLFAKAYLCSCRGTFSIAPYFIWSLAWSFLFQGLFSIHLFFFFCKKRNVGELLWIKEHFTTPAIET